MKTFFRTIIKWVFTIIIPLVVLSTCINYFYTFGWNGWSMTLIWSAVITVTLINAMFYTSYMRTTHLLPKIKCQWSTGVGIYMRKVNFHWELDLPLFTIIFQRRK